jgi:hypothetical protein
MAHRDVAEAVDHALGGEDAARARSAICSAATGPPDLSDMVFPRDFAYAPTMIAGLEDARDTWENARDVL